MLTNFLQDNKVGCSILLFMFIFIIIYYLKPKFLFNEDGSLREFGIGYSKKTIFPIWLLSIFLGILSYLFIFAITRYY